MARDQERIHRIQAAIRDAGWDALVCTLPANVLLLSGYWPVVGTSLAIATRDGQFGLVVPEDERKLAERGWADEVQTFQGGTLDEIKKVEMIVRTPLAHVARKLRLGRIIGCERGASNEPASYAAMHLYGGSLAEIIYEAMPGTHLVPADAEIAVLRAVKTPDEIQRLRTACQIAQIAYTNGAKEMHAGMSEAEVAARFREPLSVSAADFKDVERADGFTYCMSGPNAAEAHAAYQRSRSRTLEPGDMALVHCNSYADGYWTDITRTFCMGRPDKRQRELYDAVFAAREAALNAIAPNVKTAEVDRAARQVIRKHGYPKEFKHACGHGVGFSAINHNSPPRIHPASEERLEIGMVFNVEPGIYIDGWGGLRHCDMVAVTTNGAELLTPFQSKLEELVVG